MSSLCDSKRLCHIWIKNLNDNLKLFIYRYACFHALKTKICSSEESLSKFAEGYNYFGYHAAEGGGVVWREWAPGATAMYLRGDFS